MARVLIVNPFASGVTERRLASVQAALPAGTETIFTQARGDATDLAAEWSPSAEAIYVFSGDGTYNEVINGLRADIPVGFVPGGGTSVLPRALGLPRDPTRAATRIAQGTPRRISLGRLNGRIFAFNAGIGFDAELSAGSMRRAAVRTASDPATSRSAGRSSRRSSTIGSGTRRRSRSTGSAGPRSRSSPTARPTPMREPSASALSPVHRSRGGSTSSPRSRSGRAPCLGSPARRCVDGPVPTTCWSGTTWTGRDPLRCAAAGAARRRGHRRRARGGDRRRA